jgi:hypothetical protein
MWRVEIFNLDFVVGDRIAGQLSHYGKGDQGIVDFVLPISHCSISAKSAACGTRSSPESSLGSRVKSAFDA